MWQAVVLGNDSADRILVGSGISNRHSGEVGGLLTSITAVNPGSPDNLTLNVGGRG